MSDIGNLIVKIGADASGLEKAFKQLGGSASQFQRGLSTIGSTLATGFVAVAVAATAMSISAGKQAEQLEQLASITGINTDKLQEYDVMLNRAGLNGDDLANVMKKMSVSMEQARLGTGNAGDRFRQLGIDIRTVTSTDDLIRRVTQASSQFADGAQKAALMTDLLGRGWQTFIKTFAGGKKAFDDVTAASKQLGLTLSTTQLATLAQMDTAVDDLEIAWKRFAQQMAVVVAPSIKFVVDILKDLLAWGSHAFNELNLQLDIFATRLTHLVLKAGELGNMPLSSWLLDDDGWKQAVANMAMIDHETEAIVSRIRAAHELSRQAPPADTRAELPGMIDSSKAIAAQQALMDAQIAAKLKGLQAAESINRAGLQNELAVLDERRAAGYLTEYELGKAKQAAMMKADQITVEGLQNELNSYKAFATAKLATYTRDQKGQEDRAKFDEEQNGKRLVMIDAVTQAEITADTTRIQSGLAVKTFWLNQLDAITQANAFSVAQIITTWSGGIANALVTGEDFVKQSIKSTEIAVIQGVINLGVQKGAELLKQFLFEKSLNEAAAASKIIANETADAAIVASNTGAAAASVGLWAGATTAISGMFAGVMVLAKTFWVEALLPALIAIGKTIVSVMTAIADLMADTIFGIPVAVAMIAGIALLVGTLAAAGALKFDKGGIGNFGTGTPAMLHKTEAIIPLDSRGAGFMQQVFGGASDRPQVLQLFMDGRQFAIAMSDHTPGSLRTMGVL